LGVSGVLSIIIGSVSAIYQKRLKRLFAYSTIAHTGFILLAFLIFSLESSKALVFYIIIYSCLTIALFAILINISISNPIQPKYLVNVSSIGSKNYIFSVSFGFIILAIAGIPPLAGFFSKFFILLSLIGCKFYFVSFVVIFFSSVSCFYYIRLVKIIFFIKGSKKFYLNNKQVSSKFRNCYKCLFIYYSLLFLETKFIN
jgi:NADH:ubiquinone oxidoreductase subunit 2 (subunit N)